MNSDVFLFHWGSEVESEIFPDDEKRLRTLLLAKRSIFLLRLVHIGNVLRKSFSPKSEAGNTFGR